MKLEFDSVEEMINFLRSQGYIVGKNWGEITPWNPYPPYHPMPTYPYPPITVGDTTKSTTPKVYM